MYPARSILETGGEIAGASDWPVSTANPFEAIFQAETRSGPQGVLQAAERVPREAMLYAYTRNSAEVLGQVNDVGTIAPGKRADLVLLDRDVLTVPAEEMKATSRAVHHVRRAHRLRDGAVATIGGAATVVARDLRCCDAACMAARYAPDVPALVIAQRWSMLFRQNSRL